MNTVKELKGKTFECKRISTAKYCKEDLQKFEKDLEEYVGMLQEDNPGEKLSIKEEERVFRLLVDGKENGQMRRKPIINRESKGKVIVKKSGEYIFINEDGEKSHGTTIKKDMLREYGFELETMNGTYEYHLQK